MTEIQIIEAKYEKIFIALFEIIDFDGYLILKKMKDEEIESLKKQSKELTSPFS